MSQTVIKNGTVILPDRLLENGAVAIEAGRILAVGPADAVAATTGDSVSRRDVVVLDAGGGYVCPGFVDLHVHGGRGADFMDGTAEAVRTANRCHARHGTTTIFPTTTTGSPEQLRAMLLACRAVRDGWSTADGAWIGGVHYYGPYFAADKVGCHSPHGRRDPDAAEYGAAFDFGIIRIATCAAELPGAEAFFREASARGYLCTCGHSNSSWAEMQRAFDAGMRHVDHFWCAMSSVASLRQRCGTPMQASMEQFVLANRGMSTEVIADGMHLSPELLRFAWSMKGAERLCLVTDANRAVDMPPGRYRFGPESDGSWFESDGRVGFANGALASTVKGLDHMVRHMHHATGCPLEQAVRMASLTPAERVGMDREIGSLAAGKRADILVLDRELSVQRVFIAGKEIAT
jgi:N-acetylglucosamine-6-phosphate deacetylase